VSTRVADARPAAQQKFPVTVDPEAQLILEDPEVEAMLARPPSSLAASTGMLRRIFEELALRIAKTDAYRLVAGVAGAPDLFVRVQPGERQEQIAASFARELGWSPAESQRFLDRVRELEPEIGNGMTVPGVYFASVTEPEDVAMLIDQRFDAEILSRYGTSTEAQVPLADALTIASMLQREAAGWDDIRIISGIMWNRLFAGQRLQIDATLQYAEASRDQGRNGWWPSVQPADKAIRSPYNTYRVQGLPPGPIANPSIDAIVAALNPKRTDCMFYFHDADGGFHCTRTYREHVALLRKYY
jgi:UPF0755 protein